MAKHLTLLFFLICSLQLSAQVKIGSLGAPNTNAVLELDGGINKGLLLPKLTGPQITALNTAPDGLFVYNTTDGFLYLRKGGAWQKITDATTGGGGLVLPYLGTAATTAGNPVFKIQNTSAGIGISGEALGAGYGVTGFSNTGTAGFFTSTSGPALVTGTGNVGIGTSILYPPTFPLDVTGRIRLRNKSGETPGIWFEKISTPLEQSSFLGVLNDSIIGLYGTKNNQWKFFFNHENNNFGIYNSNPRAPLSFQALVGNKIDFFYQSPTSMYGIGLQSAELQLYTNDATAHTSIGYGSSASFTETFRVNAGNTVVTNPQVLLPGTQVASYLKTGNSYTGAIKTTGAFPLGSGARLGLFTGASSDINSLTERMSISNSGNVGIGVTAPSNPLSFPATTEKKISLYPGATGDVGLAVAGNELRIYSDNVNAVTTIGYDDFTNGFTENFRINPQGSSTLSNPTVLNTNVQDAAYFKTGSYYTGAIKTIGTGTVTSRLGLFAYSTLNSANLREYVSIADGGNVGINTTNPNSRLQVEGGVSMPIRLVSDSYTLTDADYSVRVIPGNPGPNISLPSPVGRTGRIYIISADFPYRQGVNYDEASVLDETGQNMLSRPAYHDPDGYNFDYLLNVRFDNGQTAYGRKRKTSVTVQSDGAKWHIIGNDFQY